MSTYLHLPAGVKHHSTNATATSWEAWDALTETAGWTERSWYVEGNGQHTQKEASIDECRVVVFPPSGARS